MAYRFWEYFLAIEADLAKTTRYVEFCVKNYDVFSVEFSRILLSSSSEIDVICKSMCSIIDPVSSPKNINDYRQIITSKYPQFYSIEVFIPRYELIRKPWESWKTEYNPFWWKSYNLVKHQRDDNYECANLEFALDSVCGLFAVVLYLHRIEGSMERLYPYPQLLDLEKSPGALLLESIYGLPDFE